VVYAYTQAGPLMIRVLWGWTDQSPPVSAAYYLQVLGYLIVIAAIIGSLVRGLGIYLALRSKKVTMRSRRLLVGLLRADKKLAFTRRVPLLIQVTFLAVVMSLFVSGIVGNLLQGAVFFLFVWVLLFLRTIWLPRLASWQTWARLLASIPLLLRVLLGVFLTYYICGWLIEQLYSAPVLVNSGSGSFQWLLISSCIGLVIMTALTPQPPASLQQRRPRQSVLTSPPMISPQAPPLMGPSR